MSRKILIIPCLIVRLLWVGNPTCAQAIRVQNEDRVLAQMQVENVRIETQSIGQLFSDLSLSYNIPIGVEVALNDDELVTYRLNVRKTTLSNLLTAFVAQHSEYSWQIKHGVVRVFPTEGHHDVILGKLLIVEINSFVVAENTSCSTLEKSLIATSEVKRFLNANGISYRERNSTGFYFPQVGRKFTLNAFNSTFESILNRVIKESPSARFWLVTRNSYDHTVLLKINARLEPVSLNSIMRKEPGVWPAILNSL